MSHCQYYLFSIEVLVDIFSFFNRQQLLGYETVSRPIKALIDSYFMEAENGHARPPFIAVDGISLEKRKQNVYVLIWMSRSNNKQKYMEFFSLEMALPWLIAPYVRSQEFHIYRFFPSKKCPVQSFLNQIAHCWRDHFLLLQQEHDNKEEEEQEGPWTLADTEIFIQTVCHCSELSMFRKTLPKGFLIGDLFEAHSVEMRLQTFESNFDGVMNWLESTKIGLLATILKNPASKRSLLLHGGPIKFAEVRPLLNVIKERFQRAQSAPALPFHIKITLERKVQPANIFDHLNVTTDEEMRCTFEDRPGLPYCLIFIREPTKNKIV